MLRAAGAVIEALRARKDALGSRNVVLARRCCLSLGITGRYRDRHSPRRGGRARAPAQDRDGQHNSGYLLPVGTLSFGVKQVQTRYRVPLVISGEDGCCRGDIVDCGITWRRRHDQLLSGADE